ncbi:MAG: septation regulator SpoVG [Actinobacteria bacterium]|nr:septation regulator SpoVG [Actinomycetota bacterium]
MKVTKVDVRLRNDENTKLKAIASVTFDDEFVVHGIRVVEGEKGMFIAMPSKKTADGKHKDIAHPLKTETRQMIQEAVLAEYAKKKSE